MSKAEVADLINGYQFTWPDKPFMVLVTRVRMHTSDGRVTGEIQIRDKAGGVLYPQTAINFTSEQTRNRFAKALVDQSDPDSPTAWGEMINQVSVIVIDRARLGEPVRELWTSDDVPAPEFLLYPILYRELPTIIFGEKASCKSTLALAAYTCLLLGWSDNPLGWQVSRDCTKCLLMDYEVDADIAQYNIKQIQRGMGLPAFPLYYRRSFVPLADDIEQIQEHMARLEATVIIVDSLGPAVGGDLKDAAQALRFTSALRRLRCAALVIGQTSKDRESKVKSVYGSTFFEYYARHIFELRKEQEEGEDSLDVALYNTYHNLGKRFPAQGFHIDFTPEGTRIESCTITVPELVRRLGAGNQIKHLLRRGPRTAAQITQELEMNDATVRSTLKRLKDKGLIIKVEDGWGWAAHNEST